MTDKKEEPIAPFVHLNGTAGHVLIEQLTEAIGLVRVAHDGLARTWPNARDYYPLGLDVIGKAEVQAAARSQKLREVMEELDGIRDLVRYQIEARRR